MVHRGDATFAGACAHPILAVQLLERSDHIVRVGRTILDVESRPTTVFFDRQRRTLKAVFELDRVRGEHRAGLHLVERPRQGVPIVHDRRRRTAAAVNQATMLRKGRHVTGVRVIKLLSERERETLRLPQDILAAVGAFDVQDSSDLR